MLVMYGLRINFKSEHSTFEFDNVPSYVNLKFLWTLTQDLGFTFSGMFLV